MATSRSHPPRFESGGLQEAVRRRAERALRIGTLQRIATRCQLIEEAGIRFVVRQTVPSRAREEPAVPRSTSGVRDPFLPYDEDLFVADLSPSHVCLLNKYVAVDHHVLIVTRRYEEQESPLDADDFEALWIGLREIDGLGFYNSGPLAGASQRHKHLQIVPLPLDGGSTGEVPVDAVLRAALRDGKPARVPELPFVHVAAPMGAIARLPPGQAGPATRELYEDLMRRLGPRSRPYNLLVTRKWMFAVARTREGWHSIPINALGFGGALLVRSDEQLALVRQRGPLAVLREVAVPLSEGGLPPP